MLESLATAGTMDATALLGTMTAGPYQGFRVSCSSASTSASTAAAGAYGSGNGGAPPGKHAGARGGSEEALFATAQADETESAFGSSRRPTTRDGATFASVPTDAGGSAATSTSTAGVGLGLHFASPYPTSFGMTTGQHAAATSLHNYQQHFHQHQHAGSPTTAATTTQHQFQQLQSPGIHQHTVAAPLMHSHSSPLNLKQGNLASATQAQLAYAGQLAAETMYQTAVRSSDAAVAAVPTSPPNHLLQLADFYRDHPDFYHSMHNMAVLWLLLGGGSGNEFPLSTT